jgi:serine/threonine protein kinase
VLFENGEHTLAIADFGIASFTDDQLVTLVETAPTQHLAKCQYAAPEQRVAAKMVSATADIYALGLMLNGIPSPRTAFLNRFISPSLM